MFLFQSNMVLVTMALQEVQFHWAVAGRRLKLDLIGPKAVDRTKLNRTEESLVF